MSSLKNKSKYHQIISGEREKGEKNSTWIDCWWDGWTDINRFKLALAADLLAVNLLASSRSMCLGRLLGSRKTTARMTPWTWSSGQDPVKMRWGRPRPLGRNSVARRPTKLFVISNAVRVSISWLEFTTIGSPRALQIINLFNMIHLKRTVGRKCRQIWLNMSASKLLTIKAPYRKGIETYNKNWYPFGSWHFERITWQQKETSFIDWNWIDELKSE